MKNPEKTRQGKQEDRRPERRQGKQKMARGGFAFFFAVEQGVRNKRLW